MVNIRNKPAIPVHNDQSDPLIALERLALQTNEITLYSAGLPNFPSNFARDSLLSAILMRDPVMLRNQLVFCALLQGTERNPYSGEEPGKIFHEMPPSKVGDLTTEFNACDTTALFIYGHEIYKDLTGDEQFVSRQKKYIEKAVDYILSHLVNYLFVEDPKYAGAPRFALKLTYWKDSQVTNRINGVPSYPAVFTLAHVQNMRALKSAARLLQESDLLTIAGEMKRHLTILYDEKRGVFYSGVDRKGFFQGISSDNLHILYYLEPGELAQKKIDSIVEASKILETPIGYMTLNTGDKSLKQDITQHRGYHSNTVWPFEQAFIHSAAQKLHLKHVMNVSQRIIPQLNSFPELLAYNDGVVTGKGSKTQLWTIATKIYFDSVARFYTHPSPVRVV